MSEDSDNNVVSFTDKWLERKEKEYDSMLDEYGEEEEYSEYDETLHYIYDALLDSLQEVGVADDSEEFVKDFAYAMEAIRSVIDRSFGNDHSFHKVVDRKLHISRNIYGEIVSVDWLPELTKKD